MFYNMCRLCVICKMMKKIFLIVVLSLLLSISAYAGKFSAKVGDIVENEVSFGKRDKFPLPPGEFTVEIIKKWQDFRDVLLVQIDEDTGIIKWKIHLAATGSTIQKNSAWLPGEMCDQTSVYFIKAVKGSEKFACWSVSHSRRSGGNEINRLSRSNNFFSFGQTMTHKIRAEQGYPGEMRAYENQNDSISPDMFVVSRYHYSKKSKLFEAEYFYNPEFDGIPKPKNSEWASNEFHIQNIRNYPEHEEFLKKYISISANLVDRFNELNKVKGGLRLDAEEYFTKGSFNVEKKEPKKVKKSTKKVKKSTQKDKGDIVNQIKGLKDLLDAGVITQDEFNLAKKKILN